MAQEPQGKFFDRVKSLDLYALIEVEADADVKAIKKAYRKKALTCHPDKNPDNKEAVELFHQLSDALEVLSDEKTRSAYDNLLKARKAAELRIRQLDGKRRKLRDDLDERERNAKVEETIAKVRRIYAMLRGRLSALRSSLGFSGFQGFRPKTPNSYFARFLPRLSAF